MAVITETTDAPISAESLYFIKVGDVFKGSLALSEEVFDFDLGGSMRADIVVATLEEGTYQFHVGGSASGAGTLNSFAFFQYLGPDEIPNSGSGFSILKSTSDLTGREAPTTTLPEGTYYFLVGGQSGTYQFAITEQNTDPGFAIRGESIPGTSGDDVLEGTPDDDTLFGLSGDDTLDGGLGNDSVNGGSGIDTLELSGLSTDYTVVINSNGITQVTNRSTVNSTDSIEEVEKIDFLLGTDLDLQAIGDVANTSEGDLDALIEMYIAYFNRAPDALGLYFWGSAFANGTSLEDIASLFLDQDETRSTYPEDATNLEFATQVYSNVLGRIPDQDGLNFWEAQLNSGYVSRDAFILEVLNGAKAESPDGATQAFIDLQIEDRTYLEAKTDIGTYFAVTKGLSNVSDASEAMELYLRGNESSIQSAVVRIDQQFGAASALTDGELLLQLVGVVDDPFSA